LPTSYPFSQSREATAAADEQLNVTLKYRWQLNDTTATDVTAALVRAVNMLRLAYQASLNLPDSGFMNQATILFKGEVEGEYLQTVQRVLRQSYDGLVADPTLKLGTREKTTLGSVHYHTTSFPFLAMKHENGKSWKKGNGDRIASTGAIHIRAKAFANRKHLLAKTIIHEATHKYANTWDFGEQGYWREKKNDYGEPGLTHNEARRNADTYAMFAYTVGALSGL